jgi:hypothetical protein
LSTSPVGKVGGGHPTTVADRRYSTARWQRLRRQVLARDGGVCQIQGPAAAASRTRRTTSSRAPSTPSCSGVPRPPGRLHPLPPRRRRAGTGGQPPPPDRAARQSPSTSRVFS